MSANTDAVLKAITEHSAHRYHRSAPELARITGLSLSSVRAALTTLRQRGKVERAGQDTTGAPCWMPTTPTTTPDRTPR